MRSWIVAVVAGATIGMGTADLQAQGNSQRARQERAPATGTRQQQPSAREQEQRERDRQRENERDRLRAEREAEGRRAIGVVAGNRGVVVPARNDDRREEARRVEERRRIEEMRRAEQRRIEQRRIEARRQEERRREEERRRYDDRYDSRYDDRYDDRYDRQGGWDVWDRNTRTNARRQGGPAFCRNGTGHPVFGRQWCRDKGWALGNGRNDRDVWNDVILRQPRDRRYDQSLGRTVLQEILGAVLLGRVEGYGRQYASGSTTGRWLEDGNNLVLQLNVGSTPVARLIDANRDGRLDRVMLRQ